MKKKRKMKSSAFSMSKSIDQWGESNIGLSQLMKETGNDYWKTKKMNKLKKVV